MVNKKIAPDAVSMSLASEIRAEMGRQRINKRSLAELSELDSRTITRVLDGNAGVSLGIYIITAASMGKVIKFTLEDK